MSDAEPDGESDGGNVGEWGRTRGLRIAFRCAAGACGVGLLALGYVYMDIILLLLPWRRAVAIAPKWVIRAGVKRVLQESGKTAAIAILVKPSWRRRTQRAALRARSRIRAGRRLVVIRWRGMSTRGRVLAAAIPVGALVLLLSFLGILWTFVIPLIGVPRALIYWLRGMAARFAIKTGLSTLVPKTFGFLVHPARSLLESARFRTLRRMVHLRSHIHDGAGRLLDRRATPERHGEDP